MQEKRLKIVPLQNFATNGTLDGKFTLSDASLFKVKQKVVIIATSLPNLELEVKKIEEDGVTIYVGPIKGSIDSRSDLSLYTTAAAAAIFANEQPRPSIPEQEIERLTYEEEPVVARRIVIVDELGRKINQDNPLPTTATLSGDVTINANGFDSTLPDSMLATGSEDGTKTGVKHAIRVDSALDLLVGISNGANKANVNATNELSVIDQAVRTKLDSIITALGGTIAVNDTASQTILANILTALGSPISVDDPVSQAILIDILAALASIDAGTPVSLGQKAMTGSQPVVIASDQSAIPVSLTDEPIKISGTVNGLPNGTEYTFVNNIRQQIMASHDRIATISYADFGTKNQRVTEIAYTSATFPGTILKKQLLYTLQGNRYRRDNINWLVI